MGRSFPPKLRQELHILGPRGVVLRRLLGRVPRYETLPKLGTLLDCVLFHGCEVNVRDSVAAQLLEPYGAWGIGDMGLPELWEAT